LNSLNLKAGYIDLMYENGFLRYVKYGGHEVVRMIYFALRDENWGTYAPYVENEVRQIKSNSFHINYDCYHKKEGINIFHWRVNIEGLESGQINFKIHGTALTDLLKNRAGFCVLHPIRETIGQPCTIIHSDGKATQTQFPEWVAPENPFHNIRAFQWEVDGHTYELHYDGDVFETEDQRNWTDASFKTFCTPLSLPFPVVMKKGDTVSQSVIFKSANLPHKSAIVESNLLTSVFSHAQHVDLGICASTEADVLNREAIRALTELNLSHYRIEVFAAQPDWKSKFIIDANNAQLISAPLEIALHLPADFENLLNDFIRFVSNQNIPTKRIILFSASELVTHQRLINHAPKIKQLLPGMAVGGGTDYNFTELNRNRFDATPLDFVTFAIHPQEHAFDDLSLMETLEAQRDVVLSARHLYPNKLILISPLTLRKRYNPYTKNPTVQVLTNDQKSDSRQTTPFAAHWAEKSIQQLSQAGVCSITLFQSVGQQGILTAAGELYPVYEIIRSAGLRSKQN
jgi:D-apionolactonase